MPAAGELDVAALRSLTAEFLALYKAAAGTAFPRDPAAQLAGAVEAVFHSWRSPGPSSTAV